MDLCTHTPYGTHNCNPATECVRLYCSEGGPRPEVPLTLTHHSSGILNAVYNGETRAICDDAFNENSASVACFELYGDRGVHSWSGSHRCTH